MKRFLILFITSLCLSSCGCYEKVIETAYIEDKYEYVALEKKGKATPYDGCLNVGKTVPKHYLVLRSEDGSSIWDVEVDEECWWGCSKGDVINIIIKRQKVECD